jgi:hypothetical protein
VTQTNLNGCITNARIVGYMSGAIKRGGINMGKRSGQKGTVKLRTALEVVDELPDEFTARQFVDKWLDLKGGRLCPMVAGARSLCVKVGCRKTGKKWRGMDLWRKPTADTATR